MRIEAATFAVRASLPVTALQFLHLPVLDIEQVIVDLPHASYAALAHFVIVAHFGLGEILGI